MGDKKPIQLYVSAERKQRWEEAADEQGYSLSGAIRSAMHSTFIADDSSELDTEALRREVEDANQEVIKKIEQLQDTAETIELAVRDDPDLDQLIADIYEKLPRLSQQDMRSIEMDGAVNEWGSMAATIPGLMDEFGRSRTRILEALNQLRLEVAQVQRAEEHGDEYYYVEQ